MFHCQSARKCLIKALPLVATLLAPNAAVAQSADLMHTGASFFDDFAVFFRSRWQISHGWSNGPPQDCSWSTANVPLGDRSLSLVVNDKPTTQRSFSCAEVQSRGSYGYGTYEVRMRSTAATGVLSAFYVFVSGGGGKPHEQVSVEFLGKDPAMLLVNYNSRAGNRARTIALDFDSSKSVNNYAFQWTPEGIRWFVNGRVVHEVKAVSGEALPSRPGKIILTNWKGTVADQQTWLVRSNMRATYCRYNREYVAFTGLGRPCQSPSIGLVHQ